MTLRLLTIRNFRCFDRLDVNFHERMTLLSGPNGSGKTSILEAIQVIQMLRSFRTPTIRDLIKNEQAAFSLRATIETTVASEEIHVAYGAHERVVELNGVAQTSRREIRQLFHVLSITEDDMRMVQGFPEIRRLFLDQVSVILHPTYRDLLQRHNQLSKQRASLCMLGKASDDIALWTEQVWGVAQQIRTSRRETAQQIAAIANTLLADVDAHFAALQLSYRVNNTEREAMSVEEWLRTYHARELRMRRGLCGAQFDELDIIVEEHAARRFASRGMQKLLVMVLKLAQVKIAGKTTLLLDDLMADFDDKRLELMLHMLHAVDAQLIVTVPRTADTALHSFAQKLQGSIIAL